VRGNSKVIQELEAQFRGAGWNVIKVIWGSGWDELLANDPTGALLKVMSETVDGEYQDYKSKNGAYVREHFFGKSPETAAMVAGWSDDQIWALVRGGHDPLKVYAAYKAATEHKGQPTVILAKTVKGYGMGEAGEGQNITHQQKKMGDHSLREFRDRFQLEISDEKLAEVPFMRFAEDSAELRYLRATIAMVWWAWHSDRTCERRWHVGLPLLIAAAALVLMPFVSTSLWMSLALLTVVTAATYATYGPFWSLPSLFLTGSSAAVGLAAINSIANLGGFVGPVAYGALKDATGSIYAGLAFVSLTMLFAGILIVRLHFVRVAEASIRSAALANPECRSGRAR
jgi:hypothetical protein